MELKIRILTVTVLFRFEVVNLSAKCIFAIQLPFPKISYSFSNLVYASYLFTGINFIILYV